MFRVSVATCPASRRGTPAPFEVADVLVYRVGIERTRTSTLPYTRWEMNGTAAIDVATATVNTISASLNRQGKRFVQCLVRSKNDIAITLTMFGICLG